MRMHLGHKVQCMAETLEAGSSVEVAYASPAAGLHSNEMV